MNSNLEFLSELEAIVRRRIELEPEGSYTAELVESGIRRVAQKVGEEGVELAIAAATGEPQEQLEEAADLLFHMIVLLACSRQSLSDVARVLQDRHQKSSDD